MNPSRRRALLGLLSLPVSLAAQGCLVQEPRAPFEPAPDRVSARKKLFALSEEYEALMRRHGELAFRVAAEPARVTADPLALLRRKEAALARRAERLLEYHEALLPPSLTQAWQLASLGLALLEDRETQALEAKLSAAQLAPSEVAGRSLGRSEVEILLRSPRPEERDVAASALVALQSRCEPIAKELLLRRRACARELGEDYYEALLRVRRVNLQRLEHLAQAFVRGTDADTRVLVSSLRRMLRVAVGRKRGTAAAHDLEFALERLTLVPDAWFPEERALVVANDLASRLGLDDAAQRLVALRSVSAAGCAGETLTIPVSIPGDARPLAREKSGLGHWADVLAELGRLVQLTSLEEREPLLKGYPWIPGMTDVAFDRGFAEIFSSLLAHARILEGAGGLTARQSARVVAVRRTRRLFELRRRLAWMTFERRALANPKQDLARLAGQSNTRLTGLDTPVFWATDRRLVECPGVEPGALLGAFFACDVHAWLRDGSDDDLPELTSAKGHQLVAALLGHGVGRSIDEKMIALRGHRLSARAAVLQLTRRRPPRQRSILL